MPTSTKRRLRPTTLQSLHRKIYRLSGIQGNLARLLWETAQWTATHNGRDFPTDVIHALDAVQHLITRLEHMKLDLTTPALDRTSERSELPACAQSTYQSELPASTKPTLTPAEQEELHSLILSENTFSQQPQ